MKTMKMIISIVAFIVIFFYLAETKIQFSPLKISVGNTNMDKREKVQGLDYEIEIRPYNK